MDTELKTKWIDALRGGKYEQGKGYLRSASDNYCCLGVLADLSGCRWVEDDDRRPCFKINDAPFRYDNGAAVHMLGSEFLTSVGIEMPVARHLAEKNDLGCPFSEIADYIEANL